MPGKYQVKVPDRVAVENTREMPGKHQASSRHIPGTFLVKSWNPTQIPGTFQASSRHLPGICLVESWNCIPSCGHFCPGKHQETSGFHVRLGTDQVKNGPPGVFLVLSWCFPGVPGKRKETPRGRSPPPQSRCHFLRRPFLRIFFTCIIFASSMRRRGKMCRAQKLPAGGGPPNTFAVGCSQR